MRVKCRFHFAQFCKSSSPKTPGCIQRENLCRARPTTNHRISQSAPPRHQRFASSKSLVEDRTYPALDGRARHLRRRDRTYRSLSRGCRAAREIQQYNPPVFRRYAGILSKRNWLSGTFGIAKQTNGFFCALHRYVHPPASSRHTCQPMTPA